MIDAELRDSSVVICDDSITNTLVLKALLEAEGVTRVTALTDPRRVLPSLSGETECDLLLLDLEMPHQHGFEVMEDLHARLPQRAAYLPILVITGTERLDAKNKALSLGATDFIHKPFDQNEVVLRVRNLLRLRHAYVRQLRINEELERQVQARTEELTRATDAFVFKLGLVCEMRDRGTGAHIRRVGRLARMLAEAVGLPANVCFMIERAAPLHDVGKIGVPDEILLKAGKLTDAEFTRMKTHTGIGESLLDDHDSMMVQMAASIAASHHERWDGTGYPEGLRGESIPIEGRITAICDVFDALTSLRPYKSPWSVQDAVDHLVAESGKHFDPALVDIFVQHLDEVQAIRLAADAEAMAE